MMWKGEELWQFAESGQGKYSGTPDPGKWQELPGVILSFNYSGKGPLPAAREFVLKLEKPLPLGSYRLFVKNFYLGKMEATLGDVTRPLNIRRYDWTSGALFETNAGFDRITLRYFPSDIVADNGAAQQQYYIVQGVFVTTEAAKVPIRGGEIIETLPLEVPPTKAGNYLDNSDFEVGLFPWGKPFGISAAYGPENLDGLAAHGELCFKRQLSRSRPDAGGVDEQILESRNYSVAPGKYTLSFYARADGAATLIADVRGVTEDLKNEADAGISRSVQLGEQWQRYSVTATLSPMPYYLYHIVFSVRSAKPLTVWLDAVQLENGELTDFEPQSKTEVGYRCLIPGHIFYSGQASDIELLVSDRSGAASIAVDYAISDYFDKEVARGRQDVAVTGGKSSTRFKLPAEKTGIFRAVFSAGGSRSEFIYSVLPANPHLEAFFPEGTLGVDTFFGDKQLTILKRANFNWAISKMLARWYLVEKEQGKFVFDDASLASAGRAKMNVLLQALNPEWGRQAWLLPLCKPDGGGLWDPLKKQQYMDAWGRYLAALVKHNSKQVKYWEIENEPNALFSAEDYGQLLRVAAQSIKENDPEAKVVGFSGGGFDEKFYGTGLKTAGDANVEVLSVHLYTGNNPESFAGFSSFLKKHSKPGWNTETGTTCPSFFTTLLEYDSLRHKDYASEVQEEVRNQTIHTVRNYLLTLSVGGMEKYFYYFCRFVNSGPSQPTSRFGSGKELAEFDGSLRANAVALSIASHFFDGAKYHGQIPLDQRLQLHVFSKKDLCVGFLWSEPQQPLTLSNLEGITLYDVMGNVIDDGNPKVADSPIYFSFHGTIEDCARRWSTVKVKQPM